MKRIHTGSLIAIALTGYGAAAQAQEPQKDDHAMKNAEQTEHSSQSAYTDEMTGPVVARQATGLADTPLMSDKGENIGKINEVVYSNVTGDFYGVIEVDGILGIGDAERLVALDDLEYDANENVLYLSPIQKAEELAEYDADLFSESDAESTVQLRSRTSTGSEQ